MAEDETQKPEESAEPEAAKEKPEAGASKTFKVMVKGRVTQTEHGGFDVENATLSIAPDFGEEERPEAEAEEAGVGEDEQEAGDEKELGMEERLLTIAGKYAQGEIDVEGLLDGVAEATGKSAGEVRTGFEEALKKRGIESIEAWRKKILEGEVAELAELLPDGPVKDAVLTELAQGEEEGAGKEEAASAEEGEEGEVREGKEEGEAEVEGEEGEERVDRASVQRKAEWVYNSAKAYGRGKMGQEDFERQLVQIVSKEESPDDEQIQNTRDEAQKKLERLGIRGFAHLQDRLWTPRFGILRKADYLPLIDFVAESSNERRLIRREVDKKVNKEIRDRILLWLGFETLAYVWESLKNAYETAKRQLYQAMQESFQETSG